MDTGSALRSINISKIPKEFIHGNNFIGVETAVADIVVNYFGIMDFD